MNLVDLFLIIVILISIWRGWQKGFIIGVLDLFILSGGLLCAFIFYPFITTLRNKNIKSLGVWTGPFAFIITLIIARFFITALVNAIMHSISEDCLISSGPDMNPLNDNCFL